MSWRVGELAKYRLACSINQHDIPHHPNKPCPTDDVRVLTENSLCRRQSSTFILVVMEDALVRRGRSNQKRVLPVLILVVMEDALVLSPRGRGKLLQKSLNPCCNERCTRTGYKSTTLNSGDSLNPCFNGRCTRTIST